MNEAKFAETRDAEIQTRIAQYEMAFRMQASVPELTDLKSEPDHVFDLYGKDSKKPGKYAYNCILARRMLESGVPFVQLFHRGWDQHGNCPRDVRYQCEDVDQPTAALVKDLKQRGMLEDTLVVCGGEFGRTIYSQGALTKDNHGRDHHGRSFSMWMAGGASGRDMSTARPMTSATISSGTRCTLTTSTPRCCSVWAATTSGVHTSTRGSISG